MSTNSMMFYLRAGPSLHCTEADGIRHCKSIAEPKKVNPSNWQLISYPIGSMYGMFYLHLTVVGNYNSPMDPMGTINQESEFFPVLSPPRPLHRERQPSRSALARKLQTLWAMW